MVSREDFIEAYRWELDLLRELWNPLMRIAPNETIRMRKELDEASHLIETDRDTASKASGEISSLDDLISFLDDVDLIYGVVSRFMAMLRSPHLLRLIEDRFNEAEKKVMDSKGADLLERITSLSKIKQDIDKYVFLFSEGSSPEELVERYKIAGPFLQYAIISLLTKVAERDKGKGNAKSIDLVKDRLLDVTYYEKEPPSLPMMTMMSTYGLSPLSEETKADRDRDTLIDNTLVNSRDKVRYDLHGLLSGGYTNRRQDEGISKQMIEEATNIHIIHKKAGREPPSWGPISSASSARARICETLDGGDTFIELRRGEHDVDASLLANGPKRRIERYHQHVGAYLSLEPSIRIEHPKEKEQDVEILIDMPRDIKGEDVAQFALEKAFKLGPRSSSSGSSSSNSSREPEEEERFLFSVVQSMRVATQFSRKGPQDNKSSYLLPSSILQSLIEKDGIKRSSEASRK